MREIDGYYSRYYREYGNDSYPVQVEQLVGCVLGVVEEWRDAGSEPVVFDIGSGPRVVADQLARNGVIAWSVDFSEIDFARKGIDTYGRHVRADGAYLPIPEESVDIVVSNMAMDLMPRRAFVGAMRVLRPGGVFVANLHHPRLYIGAESARQALAGRMWSVMQKLRYSQSGSRSREVARGRMERLQLELQALNYRQGEMPGLIFQNTRQIAEFMYLIENWSHLNVEEMRDGSEEWWHVFGVKI